MLLRKTCADTLVRLNKFINHSWLSLQMRKGIFPICIASNNGYGARILWCLDFLMFCEEKKLTPYFKFSYTDSLPNEDYLGAYFVSEQEPNNKYIRIPHLDWLDLGKNYSELLTLEKASALMSKHFVLKNDLKKYIDKFCTSNFTHQKVLGIHYRGTDKIEEAAAVKYQKVVDMIEACFQRQGSFTKLFVSTDDQNFLSFLSTTTYADLIVTHEDSFRSADNEAIHTNATLNKYDMNRDAVVNIYLLSRCDFLIKSASIMSSISLLINPEMPFVMLNKPYDQCLWFPERELIKKVAFEAN